MATRRKKKAPAGRRGKSAAKPLRATVIARPSSAKAGPAALIEGWRKPCSDEAVEKGTGRRWDAWIERINQAGGAGWSHREIAEWLHRRHRVGGWWAQMVTVGYERAIGRRAVNQKAGGFAASASLTLDAAIGEVFDAWHKPASRRRWLEDAVTVHKATKPKSLRLTGSDGRKGISVNLTEAGAGRTRVQLQHEGLASAAAAERHRKSWKQALAALGKFLAG